MGLFDFLKDKGEKLIEGDEQEALREARKADPEITTVERMKARALRNLVLGKGMKIETFELVFDDGVVTVEGHASSQEEREKTVLLLGNVRGILRVDDRLTADGYSSDAAVVVMTRDLAEVPGETVRIDPEASEEWTDAFATISGYGPDRRRLFLEVLDRIDLPTGFAGIRIDGSLVAVGMSVADDAWAGLFEMATHPAHRSRGLATCIVAALLGWSREAGARIAYLQVFEGNRPARSVYRRAGFVPAYRYWYRVPPSGLPPVPR